MFETSSLLWGILFGSVGAGYMIYGKKQQHIWALISGMSLSVLPYCSTNLAVLIPGGAALLALPYLMR